MNFSQKIKFKILQSNYKPGKPKLAFGISKGILDDLESLLTPDSEKKKDKKEDGKDNK